MSFIDERPRLPGEKYRDYIVLLIAIIGGFIPETGSRERVAIVSALVPAVLGVAIAGYYRFIPLSWKIFVAVILSCGSYFLRWFITWFAIDFNFAGDSPTLLWPVWRILFFAALFAPCAYVIPLHFVILFFEKRRLGKEAEDH
ncbi:MAG TPA: hypothetical protein VKV04_04025 [Verrucomicrobiae bacterium]|nr:hypothetical protein [Verrucomicrobiae bacterium]